MQHGKIHGLKIENILSQMCINVAKSSRIAQWKASSTIGDGYCKKIGFAFNHYFCVTYSQQVPICAPASSLF